MSPSIGSICTLSYLACYFARNILSGVTPQMLELKVFPIDFIGSMSTTWMLCYALGQIINDTLGDIIPAKYMVSGSLMLAGAVSSIGWGYLILVWAGRMVVGSVLFLTARCKS